VIDPLMGFGIQVDMGMNDMLENHKFKGGIVATTSNFRGGKVYADYQFLKYLMDFKARFERNSVFFQGIRDDVDERPRQRYILNKFEVGASYPFSASSRISINPYFIQTRYIDLATTLQVPNTEDKTNVTAPFGGARIEYVFDNTVLKGLNLYHGTRANVSLSHYQGLEESNKTFSNLEVDLRHYQSVHREITLATRVFFGHFFGNAPKSYLLGGMDNWLFNDIEGGEKGDVLYGEKEFNNSDILFHRFTTNLRGFDYNKFNGHTAFLFNAELRIPLIKYLHKGPIASNFFRNLQLIGFYDFGSAWSGNSPFEETNSINTEIISSPGSPFQASIKNFKNPWLASYGAGVRTVLLGYYLKFDVAWPIEDFIVGSPQYYLTLGYDF
jgi:outer membrane protein assembly factor BamA